MSEVRLMLGDCLERMGEIEDGSVHAVVSDPPYGIKACNRSDGGVGSIVSGSKYYGRQEWDYLPASEEVIQNILSMDVPTVIWGGNYFNLPPTSCYLVWNKMQREFTFADGEMAWTNLKSAMRIYDCSRGQLVSEGKVHPTQKPVGLMKWCLEKLRLPEGSTVLDPYMGSGTTGIACIQLGLNFIGIERDPTYFAIAEQRIADARILLDRPHAQIPRANRRPTANAKSTAGQAAFLWESDEGDNPPGA